MAIKKILICDDEPHLRGMIASALCNEGYTVIEANDGADCVRVLHHEHPDLLILDLNMPRLSGIEVLEEIEESHASLKVMILSGALDEGTRKRLDKFKPSLVVSKPFVIADLFRKIQRINKN